MKKGRVVVAMSGGVDSSVAALLLKREGYEVIGVTMYLWPSPANSFRPCCGFSAASDAERVAWKIGIPHYVMDFRDEFKKKVVDYFCSAYLSGQTPNPCIACNRYLKFGTLLQKVLGLGADFIATGHYARITREGSKGPYRLRTGIDAHKDQSYFLYPMGQFELARVLFPLGKLRKDEVRKIAWEAGLPVASKPESQDVCFVEGDYRDFVERWSQVPPVRGYFRHRNGRWLKPHQGFHRYTIGQRRGLGLSLDYPVYVVDLDPETGTIWVGEEESLFSKFLIAEDVIYLSGYPFSGSMRVQVKVRARAPIAEAVATPVGESKIYIEFSEPQRAVTPGQAVVLYQGDEVVAGGTIARFKKEIKDFRGHRNLISGQFFNPFGQSSDLCGPARPGRPVFFLGEFHHVHGGILAEDFPSFFLPMLLIRG